MSSTIAFDDGSNAALDPGRRRDDAWVGAPRPAMASGGARLRRRSRCRRSRRARSSPAHSSCEGIRPGIASAAMALPPFLTIEVPRVNGGLLRVDDAAALAEIFFSTEVSSLGPTSYDARTLTTHPDRLDREDITVLNRSFRAMIMKIPLWQPLLDAGDLVWLSALGRDWDLVTMADEDWERLDVLEGVEAAIREIISEKGRGVAQATKVLHLKRPYLVPVIDSFVAKALGARLSADAAVETRLAQTRAILEHFRTVGTALRPELEAVDAHLRAAGIERSLVRILDCLIWCSEAEAWVALSAAVSRWRA
jgi:hypothetical protein